MLSNAIVAARITYNVARKQFVYKIAQTITKIILTPLSIYLLQKLVDAVDRESDIIKIMTLLTLTIITLFFNVSDGFFDNIIKINIKRSFANNLTPQILSKFLKLEYYCFEDKSNTDTISWVSKNPNENIIEVYYNFINCITAFMSLIGVVIVFSQVSAWFAIIYFLIIVTDVLFQYKWSSSFGGVYQEELNEVKKVEYLKNLFFNKNSIFELKIFNFSHYLFQMWLNINNKVLLKKLKVIIESKKYSLASTIMSIGIQLYALITLIFYLIDDRISIGIFIAVIGSTNQVLSIKSMLWHNFLNLAKNSIDISNYTKFMSLPEINTTDNQEQYNIKNPVIEFENVTFAYPSTKENVLSNVNFKIKSGEIVALVGKNGAGKSTIVKLLCGLYKPNSGRITVNGVDVSKLSKKNLNQLFSVLFQDYNKYWMSLRENISLSSLDRLGNDEEIYEALQKLDLLDLLHESQNGIDMNLGKIYSDGIDVSGGQWQKIALTRTWFSKASFIILDEPTAALDPIAENKMYNNFVDIINQRSCIIISHRLAITKSVDKILVLDDGSIKEIGSHTELLEQGGIYADMYGKQSLWYKGDEVNE